MRSVFANIGTIVQAGFVVGTEILLDTFLVSTVTVAGDGCTDRASESVASRWRPRPRAKRTEQLPAPYARR